MLFRSCKMVQRLTYRRKHSYNTTSNKVKIVKTPGGKLTFHYRKKTASGPKCGESGCNLAIAGVPHLRPIQYSRLSKRQKTVSRAYGGALCASCVKDRVVRAFLIEEQKIVKKVLKKQEAVNRAAAAVAEKAAAVQAKKDKAAAAKAGIDKKKDVKKGAKPNQQGDRKGGNKGDKKPQAGDKKPQGEIGRASCRERV